MNTRQLLGSIGTTLFTAGVGAILAGQNGSVSSATRPILVGAGIIAAAIGALIWASLLIVAKPEEASGSASPSIKYRVALAAPRLLV